MQPSWEIKATTPARSHSTSMIVDHCWQSSAGTAGQVVVELDVMAVYGGIDQGLALRLSSLHIYRY
jgi:hypothetical protein